MKRINKQSPYCIYKRWNLTTLECFNRNMSCPGCVNEYVCHLASSLTENNYEMHPIKYAVLKTYENIGKPKERKLNHG